MSVTFSIPFNGSFPTGSSYASFYIRNLKSDVLQISENKFVGIFQQVSQNVAYMGQWTYTDYVNSNIYTTNTQQLFFVNSPIGAARLYRLSNDRVVLVRDRGLYVYNISNNDVVQEFIDDNYFVNGHIDSYASANILGSNSFWFAAWNLQDNSLLVIEKTNVSNQITGVGEFAFKRLMYNTVNNTWSETTLFNFTTLSNSEDFRSNFNSNITPIPGTNEYYIFFSVRILENIGEDMTMVWNARIDASGQILETYPIPDIVTSGAFSFTPRVGTSLTADRVIYHDRMFNSGRHWDGIEMKTLTNLGSNTAKQDYISSLYPLDSTHYFIYNAVVVTVSRLLSSTLYQPRTGNLFPSSELSPRKLFFNKLNNNLITLGQSSLTTELVAGKRLHRYDLLRIYQE